MQLNKGGGISLLKLFGLFSVYILISSSYLYAKTFENFKKTYTKTLHSSDFFLNQRWNTFEPTEFSPYYGEKKPVKISSFKQSNVKDVGPKIRVMLPKFKEYKKVKEKKLDNSYKIDFFSKKLGFDIPLALKEAEFYPQTQKGLESFFYTALDSQHDFLINNIKKTARDLNLNDWGLYLLVTKLAKNVYRLKDNARLFTWFVFNKLGYSVKAAVSRRHVVLLFNTKQVLYDRDSYSIGEDRYYNLEDISDSSIVHTYQKDYPGADKKFDFSLKSLPHFPLDIDEKELRFVDFDKVYTINYKYNKNLIDFMETYPQVQSNVYFEAPLDEISYLSIAKSLKEYINGNKANTALNFVLHFVQKSFKYQSDMEQFKKDKFMFSAQTLFYEKSDSEDRAVLFTTLVKKIFGFSVVALKYADHMNVALYIPIEGESVKVGPRRFVIAEPTYENANIGQNVYKYKNEKPKEIIELY